jgi:CheY-like chemotaxis protein
MERRRVGQAIRTHGHLSNRSRDGRSGLARPAAAPSRKLRRLLAIDDSPNLRAFIVQALTAQFPNMIVTLAPDGREGLRLARQEKPNLILLDFVLPDLPGDEVCRQLMADPATAEIPVVLMSSSSVAIESTQER